MDPKLTCRSIEQNRRHKHVHHHYSHLIFDNNAQRQQTALTNSARRTGFHMQKNEISLISITLHNHSKQVKDPSVNLKTLKQKKPRHMPTGVRTDVLNKTPFPQDVSPDDKWKLIKLKSSVQQRKQPVEQRKTPQNGKEFVSNTPNR